MPKIHSSMPHLNGHVIAAIDFETSGTRAGYHEPLQIAIVPLNSSLKPLESVRPFYTNIKPLHPERADPNATRVHKLDIDQLLLDALPPDKVQDLLIEWWESLELPFERTLVPLAHNWPFENSFCKAWLGPSLTEKLFHCNARDAMTYALGLNDKAFFRGAKALFRSVSLGDLSKTFKVENPRPHDALCDALAEAEVYRNLLQLDVL